MDNMHARTRVPGRDPIGPQQALQQDDVRRYVSPQPAVEARKKRKRFGRKTWLILAAIVVVLGLGAVAWKVFGNQVGGDGINHSEYQAVFLANGTITNNVYFGKLQRISDGYYYLSDVFYIKAAQAAGSTQTTPTNDLKLVRMGDTEIYGPQDELIIPREQVLYYQNMKADSKIVQAINKFHSTNK